MGRKASEKVGMVACHGMGGNQVMAFLPVPFQWHLVSYIAIRFLPENVDVGISV